jgi:hypothetical protein
MKMTAPKVSVHRDICATRETPVHDVHIIDNPEDEGPITVTKTQVYDETYQGSPQHYHITYESRAAQDGTANPRHRRSDAEGAKLAVKATWPKRALFKVRTSVTGTWARIVDKTKRDAGEIKQV